MIDIGVADLNSDQVLLARPGEECSRRAYCPHPPALRAGPSLSRCAGEGLSDL
jgi:hypothetical protein